MFEAVLFIERLGNIRVSDWHSELAAGDVWMRRSRVGDALWQLRSNNSKISSTSSAPADQRQHDHAQGPRGELQQGFPNCAQITSMCALPSPHTCTPHMHPTHAPHVATVRAQLTRPARGSQRQPTCELKRGNSRLFPTECRTLTAITTRTVRCAGVYMCREHVRGAY